MLLFGDGGEISEIAEQVVNLLDLKVRLIGESEDAVFGFGGLLQLDLGSGVQFIGSGVVAFLRTVGCVRAVVTRVGVRLEDRVYVASDRLVYFLLFGETVLGLVRTVHKGCEMNRAVCFGSGEGSVGVEGVHDEILESLRFARAGFGQLVVSVEEVLSVGLGIGEEKSIGLVDYMRLLVVCTL